MHGCRYLKFDSMRQIEYCMVTEQATNGAPMCDFDYKDCPHYCEALKPINGEGQRPGRECSTKQRSHIELVQTSIFGAVGEVPFKG